MNDYTYAGLVLAASMSVFQTEGASSNLVSCSTPYTTAVGKSRQDHVGPGWR